ncbi:MAG TPA: esterase-like activity of phytase family protein [Polyangia bacterium]|nr:esterase-like activity of phytase family protein [Polyangia bacterium]
MAAASCGGAPSVPPPAAEKFDVAAQPFVGNNILNASKDTMLLGGLLQNLNFGSIPFLLVERALIGFDQNALTSIAPSGLAITSGRLDVSVIGNPIQSGRARTIQLFRMTQPWTEEQSTWQCAADSNIWNLIANCPAGQAWDIGPTQKGQTNPWNPTPTATAQLQPRFTGVLSFDVTADVRGFADRSLPNYGWVIKSDDLDGGVLILDSRETSAPPRLVIATGCAAGYADCDLNPATGCEQRLNTATSCGGCGISCDDGNPCTADACSATGVCTHAPVGDGIACNDGNACTEVDTCQAGACAGGSPVSCAAADQCHAAGACDPATGACTNPVAVDGTACNDGNPCTQTDACQTGVCAGGNPVTCVAADQCHAAGVCDPASGACTNPTIADGTACNDGNACTVADRCVAGTCAAGDPMVCPSTDGCHPGVCDVASGSCGNPMACHLYGVGTVSAALTDGLAVSPLALEDGVSNNAVGGTGSAIAYTGIGNRFLVAPDRGPNAGDDSYTERYYVMDLSLDGGKVTPTLKAGAVLDQGPGLPAFNGRNINFDATNSPASLRLDVEGLRASPSGTFFISDEYGPFVYEFSADGHRLRSLNVPAKFLIDHPAKEDDELPPTNTKGRQDNRGMEGLAISPDGRKLYGLMQSPLIQDGALSGKNKRVGTNIRMLEIDTINGETREFIYPLENASLGTNEILAINDHQFLVDERDGNGGTDAAFKKYFLIDITSATDISNIAALPTTGIPAGVTAVSKKLFLDLLDPAFGLAGASFPEKIEGLALGPDLPDGRHTLYVTSDNDFLPDQDAKIYVFTIDPVALPGYVPAQVAYLDQCDGATPVTCSAADACHRAGMCNPGTATCSGPVQPSGTLVGTQVTGDCHSSQCDGFGNTVNAIDPADVPVDGNQCTSDLCLNGVPTNPSVVAGAICNQGGGSLCDGAGSCVSCVTAADCGGVETECMARTCAAGACGVAYSAAGTPTAAQVVGDCHVNQCDGAGGVLSAISDSDTPADDGNPCTVETCSSGVPGVVAAAAGLSCGAGFCDGSGSCLGCLIAADCPGADSECAQRSCTQGQCGFAKAAVGTPVAAQVQGDCQRTVCDGAGQVTSLADNSDAPSSANQCAAGTCTAGAPSTSNLPSGTACSQNGGQSCDGNGACVSPQTFRVVRLGDGSAALGSGGTAVSVDEWRFDGTLVATVAVSLLAPAGNPFTMSGSASSEGELSLSADGHYLVMAGYAAPIGTSKVASSKASAFKRAVARVDAAGHVDTSTTLATAFDSNNARGATSADGTGFWVAGAGGSSGGVWFVPFGTSGGTLVLNASLNNVRWLTIAGGQLYGTSNVASSPSVFTIGTGLPTTTGQLAVTLNGIPNNNSNNNLPPSVYGMVTLDLVPAGGDGKPDTLYLSDDSTSGGIQKWTNSGTSWSLAGTFNVSPTPVGFRGLAGSAVGNKVTLVASTAEDANGRLVVFVDDGTTVTNTVIATAGTNTVFRGVALSPK